MLAPRRSDPASPERRRSAGGRRYGSADDYAKSALADIEVIAALDGVDGIFIGPLDLAASLGHPGDPDYPDIDAAILLRHAREIARTYKSE